MDNPRRGLKSLKEPCLPIPDSQLTVCFFSLRRWRGIGNHPPQLAAPVVDLVALVVLVDVAESRAYKVEQLVIGVPIPIVIFHGPRLTTGPPENKGPPLTRSPWSQSTTSGTETESSREIGDGPRALAEGPPALTTVHSHCYRFTTVHR